MMQRQPLIFLPLALLLSACGPTVPLGLVMRQVSVDIGGAQPPPVAAPAQVAQAFPTNPLLPLPLASPLPELPASLAPSLSLCPKAGQFAVPELAADPTIEALPAAASYVYQQKGKGSNGGAIPLSLDYPPFGLRKVQPGTQGQGYDFAVTEQNPFIHTTTFKLIKPSNSSGVQQAGLYIDSLQWKQDLLFGDLTFKPLQPVLFLQLPVQQNAQYASAGTDPVHHASMTLQGQVTGKKRVDACGSLIDTWEVNVTEHIVAGAKEIELTATYDIATQYGGISVGDHVTMSAVNGDNAVAGPTPSSDLTATISQLPKNTTQ